GVLPISFTQDRVGPLAKSVADAALLLTCLRGVDPEDLFTVQSIGHVHSAPYADALVGSGSSRVGVLRELFRQGEAFAAVNAIVDEQIDAMRRRGAVV